MNNPNPSKLKCPHCGSSNLDIEPTGSINPVTMIAAGGAQCLTCGERLIIRARVPAPKLEVV